MSEGYGKLDGFGGGAPKEGFGGGIHRDGYGRGSCACSEEDWGMMSYHEEDWGII